MSDQNISLVTDLLENHYFSEEFLKSCNTNDALKQYTQFCYWQMTRLLENVSIKKEWIPTPLHITPKVTLMANENDVKQIVQNLLPIEQVPIKELTQKIGQHYVPHELPEILHEMICLRFGIQGYPLFLQKYKALHGSQFAEEFVCTNSSR